MLDWATLIKYEVQDALTYRVIVKRYPFPNGVLGRSIHIVKYFLNLTGKTS
jgi:hypothetical protein